MLSKQFEYAVVLNSSYGVIQYDGTPHGGVVPPFWRCKDQNHTFCTLFCMETEQQMPNN